MAEHRPTQEQQHVIDAFTGGSTLVVEAGAGCGKSSTLKMAAAAMPRRRGIYVAYNKALADEAKRDFPASVMCRTAHSLAFGPVGSRYKHRLNGPRLPARQVAEVLGIREPLRISNELAPLAPQQQARIVTEAVGRFCNSADPEVRLFHFAPITGLSKPDMNAVRVALLPIARKAWEDLAHVDGRLKFTHDCYLKLYQLSGPTLPCDYLLLDEAQDISPVMASIFDRQTHAQRIMVGDSAQAIYGWRGAVDAMKKFSADQRLTLSQSFRFGTDIADEANKWLGVIGERLRLRGFDQVPSRIGMLDDPDAVLCRSNGEAIGQLMAAVNAGRRAALVGGGNDIRRLAEAARDLRMGIGTSHPELFAFSSWAEVQDYVEQDASGSDLRVFVRLVDSHGPDAIIATVDRLVGEDRADVIVSTAHKAKGREWDRVRIASDFREPRPSEDGEVQLSRDESMLAYVAVTRARLVLDREGLAWIDRWVPFNPARPTFEELLDTSSLRSPEARAAVAAGEALAPPLTGMPEEQADWDDDAPADRRVHLDDGPFRTLCGLSLDSGVRFTTERASSDCYACTGTKPEYRTVRPVKADAATAGHCYRCCSTPCTCGPAEAARWSELTGLPAGPLAVAGGCRG